MRLFDLRPLFLRQHSGFNGDLYRSLYASMFAAFSRLYGFYPLGKRRMWGSGLPSGATTSNALGGSGGMPWFARALYSMCAGPYLYSSGYLFVCRRAADRGSRQSLYLELECGEHGDRDDLGNRDVPGHRLDLNRSCRHHDLYADRFQ